MIFCSHSQADWERIYLYESPTIRGPGILQNIQSIPQLHPQPPSSPSSSQPTEPRRLDLSVLSTTFILPPSPTVSVLPSTLPVTFTCHARPVWLSLAIPPVGPVFCCPRSLLPLLLSRITLLTGCISLVHIVGLWFSIGLWLRDWFKYHLSGRPCGFARRIATYEVPKQKRSGPPPDKKKEKTDIENTKRVRAQLKSKNNHKWDKI